MVGDRETDLQFAANMGVRGFQVGSNGLGWDEVAHLLLDAPRRATVERNTRETRIAVSVNLDQTAEPQIHTGLGFFDHMLEQIGKHGGFALALRCDGDTHIDEHHTIEDCALALGQALRQALGDKRGIGRYGFVLPMDEAQASAALDLSGRPYFVFEGQFPRERVGDIPTELIPHFFRSLCETLGANLHLSVQGDNAHHMVEACFKVVARALRQAIRREGSELPSTKGAL
jgi:imidazoleglycerol-phosphate dehydratase/histidinol-phosphatase